MSDFWAFYALIGFVILSINLYDNLYESWVTKDSRKNLMISMLWALVTGVLWLPLVLFAVVLVAWLKIVGEPIEGNVPSVDDLTR